MLGSLEQESAGLTKAEAESVAADKELRSGLGKARATWQQPRPISQKLPIAQQRSGPAASLEREIERSGWSPRSSRSWPFSGGRRGDGRACADAAKLVA